MDRALAGRPTGIVRVARRRSRSARYHSGANLGRCPDDGAYRQGQVLHFAAHSDRCPLRTDRPFR
jgi:hypothetical protein